MKLSSFILASVTLSIISCSAKHKQQIGEPFPLDDNDLKHELFSADSAYINIREQVSFGPRVPGTPAHEKCVEWIIKKLSDNTDTIIIQTGEVKAFNGELLPIKNIKGSLNPDKVDRIMLIAHYDTRPWADADPDKTKINVPIDGANDGASGVGVILELARVFKESGYAGGIDYLFVDAEDYGEPSNLQQDTEGNPDTWCLGTQYWLEHYGDGDKPVFAILLDMVGAKDAKFHREYFSDRYAGNIVDWIWQTAASLNFGNVFINEPGNPITDDHIYFLREGIPAIDIIENNNALTGSFNPNWHTHDDNLDCISTSTLEAVGVTLQVALENLNK